MKHQIVRLLALWIALALAMPALALAEAPAWPEADIEQSGLEDGIGSDAPDLFLTEEAVPEQEPLDLIPPEAVEPEAEDEQEFEPETEGEGIELTPPETPVLETEAPPETPVPEMPEQEAQEPEAPSDPPAAFEASACVDGVVFTVTAPAGAFPGGASLRVEAAEDEAMRHAAEAALGAFGALEHRLYAIGVVDGSGNGALPDAGKGAALVRVEGLPLEGDVRVLAMEADAPRALDATVADGALCFALADAEIYDIATVLKAEETEEETEEEPEEEPEEKPEDKPEEESEEEPEPEPEEEPVEEPVAEPVEEPDQDLPTDEEEIELAEGGLLEAELSSERLLGVEDGGFEKSATVNGVTVTVRAAAGVFDNGVELSVGRVSSNKRDSAIKAAFGLRPANVVVGARYLYDIRVLDADGKALKPASGSVEIAFAPVPQASDGNLTAGVYHVSDGGGALAATALTSVAPSGEGLAVTVDAAEYSNFSHDTLYMVEFSYSARKYALTAYQATPLSDILSAIGLSGDVEDASGSNDYLFTVAQEGGAWQVDSHRAFTTQECLWVTLHGIEYEITIISAQQGVPYLDIDGTSKTHNCTLISDMSTVWEDGAWLMALEDVTISTRIQVQGSVNVILCDGATLTAPKGIHLTGDNSLTIWGQSTGDDMGKLVVNGVDDNYAGIGGTSNQGGGHLTVNGGSVEAHGATTYLKGGAGIGGGGDDSPGGVITINGGRVKAVGGTTGKISDASGAGIGGGKTGPGGEITINGGTVEAQGGSLSAGIGGGWKGGTGRITINGGTVVATGGSNGAGIGSGTRGPGGEILITGGTVTASGNYYGAGIGGGEAAPAGNIRISGGAVTAIGGKYGAGIGPGDRGGNANCTITITGGTVTARGDEGCALGGASAYDDGANIKISGGTVKAEGRIGNRGYMTYTFVELTYDPDGPLDISVTGSQYYNCAVTLGMSFKDNATGTFFAQGTYSDSSCFNNTTLVPSLYAISIVDGTGGVVTADVASARVGDVVTLTATPALDYFLPEDGLNTEPAVALNRQGDTWTFEMPAANLTITPAFKTEWSLLRDLLGAARKDSAIVAGDCDKNGDGIIRALESDSRLVLANVSGVTLDLAGCTINRNLKEARVEGNVLALDNAVLTISDSVGGGKLTGGYNEGNGGGVSLSGGSLTLEDNVKIMSNRASTNGGGIYIGNSGALTVNSASIASNIAMKGNGGGAFVGSGSQFQMNGGVIQNNTAVSGGGVYIYDVTGQSNPVKRMAAGEICKNHTTSGDGGGVYVGAKNTFEQSGGVIGGTTASSGNMAWRNGGGVCVASGGAYTLSGGDIRNNYTRGGNGGGAYIAGRMTVGGSASVAGNKAGTGNSTYARATVATLTGNGGGVYVDGAKSEEVLSMDGAAAISGNTAKDGGGAYVNNGWLAMYGSASIAGNSAQNGGGAYVLGDKADAVYLGLDSASARVSGNSATSDGGGVYVSGKDGRLYLKDGEIADNTAKGKGGGAFMSESTDGDIYGGALRGNAADVGGGMYLMGTLRIAEGATITGNSAGEAGGLFMDGALGIYNAVTITGNRAGDADSNLYLSQVIDTQSLKPVGKVVDVFGQLGNAAIGITTSVKPNDVVVPFTSGLVASGNTAAPGGVFASDDSRYVVAWNAEHTEAVIGKAISHTVEPYDGVYDGQPHGVTVTVDGDPDAAIQFSADGRTYADSLEYTDAGEYTVYYRATASDGQVASGSAKVTIRKRAITVRANAASKDYGDGDPALTYAVDPNPGLAAGDSLTGKLGRQPGEMPGEYGITRNTLDGKNYDITFHGASLEIRPAVITISVNDTTKVYGDAEPAFSATVTGMKNGDTADEAVQYAFDCAMGEDVGEYAIGAHATFVKAGYEAAYRFGKRTVTPASVTVTADSVEKVYGDADPAFTATVTGLKRGDTADVISYSFEREPGQDVRSYSIRPVGGALQGNYSVSYAEGSLEITRAPAVIEPDSMTWENYPDEPALTARVTGLKNGDAESVITYDLAHAPRDPDNPDEGVHTITATNYAAIQGNYTVTSVQGYLMRKQKKAMVIAQAIEATYGDPEPTLSATVLGVDDGDQITYTLFRTPGTGVGSYTIDAQGEARQGDYDVEYVDATLTIKPAPVTVAADAKRAVYGDAIPALSATVTGLVNGDTADAIAYALDREPGDGAGSYAIAPSGAAAQGNYSVSYVPARLDIARRPLTVTANSRRKVYGDADPELTYGVSGLVAGDALAGALARAGGEDVGDYAITRGTLTGGDNYALTLVNEGVNLTIAPRPVTITVDPRRKVYGDADPDPVYRAEGLLNGDGLTGTPGREAGEDADTYAVTLGTLTAGRNYALSLAAGATLTVAPRALTVTANPRSKVYGESDPELTYTAEGLVLGDSLSGAMAREAGESVGHYAIGVGTLDAGGNYDMRFEGAYLTIGQRRLSVTARAAGKVYGDPDPELAYSAQGLLAGDRLTGALARASGEDAGSYAINAGTLDAGGNYDLSFTGANLTISRAAATVTAGSATKVFGENDPGFTATVAGLKNGDGEQVISYVLERAPGEDLGTYAIMPTGASVQGNYDVAYAAGSLKIVKAMIRVTADAQEKAYGDADPTLTYAVDAPQQGVTLTGALERAPSERPGSYDITIGSLSAGDNYGIEFTGAKLEIRPKAVTIGGLSVAEKAYDGSAAATVTGAARIDGAVAGDDVSVVAGSAAFDSADAGTGKAVTFTGFRLAGADAGNYTLAAQPSAKGNIVPKPLDVAWTGTGFTYDGAEHVPAASVSGLVSGDACSVRVTGAARAAGSYRATAAIDNPNYTLAGRESVGFTIAPAAATVTAKAAAKTYGDADPALEATVDGLVAGDAASLIRYALKRTAGEDAGDYAVTPSGEETQGNYRVRYVPSTMTIRRREVTVVADAKVKTEGEADPAFTYKAGGLVGKDRFTGALARRKGEDVGTYAIILGTLSAGRNYDLRFTGATLTIKAAATPTPTPTPTPKPSPVPDITLRARLRAVGDTAMKLTWTKVDGAEGYDLYFGRCGAGEAKLVRTAGAKATATYTIKNLKKGKTYNARVVAWKKVKGVKQRIGKASPEVHAIAGDVYKSRTNAASVTVKASKVTLAPGTTAAIQATVAGVTAKKRPLTHVRALRYYSSDRNVARVTEKGVVRAVTAGTCTIYVIANNGVCANVRVSVVTRPTGVSFDRAAYSVKRGRTLELMNRVSLAPAGVTSELKWSSSNAAVATVSGDGVVEGIAPGRATITVKTANGKKASATITVK